MIVFTGWPPLKRIMVGIESTWNCAAVCWFSSVLSLTMRRSGRSEAISSSTGATTRHGPHQGAQKSTSTGPSDSMTSAWKLLSVTSLRVPAMGSPFARFPPSLYKVKDRRPGSLPGGLLRPGLQGGARLSRSARHRRLQGRHRPEQLGRDIDLDEGGGHEHGHGDGDGHECRRQQLLPLAAPAGDDPCRQRQEERDQLG